MIEVFRKNQTRLVTFVLFLISIGAFWYFSAKELTLVYNDAMAHLNIARQVIDNREPGAYQLGSVWLPLNHVLSLTLVWNDWAWHSGFAGSFFSMLSYVGSALAIFFLVRKMTGSLLAAWAGILAFALNVNMLYLQSTALTEPIYLLWFSVSAWVFLLWMEKRGPNTLALLGMLGCFQVLTRYDGWFVIGIEVILIALYDRFHRKLLMKDVIADVIVFLFPVAFGIGFWLVWNQLIFGDPLYFIFGPYSAHSQQTNISEHSGLITKGHLGTSLVAYWYVVKANIGLLAIGASTLGLLTFFFRKYGTPVASKVSLLLLLFSPIFFNILSLFLGFSIVNIPELDWNPSGKISDQWFNVRYGILALPAVAVLIGFLAGFRKTLAVGLILLVFVQGIFLVTEEGIVTVTDGTIGSSSFANQDIADFLRTNAADDGRILLSMSFFNPVAFRSGFHLNRFIHEGVSREWGKSLEHPEDFVRYIVMSNGDVGEPIHTALVKRRDRAFLYFYTLAFRGEHADVYRLKTTDELFVRRTATNLILGKEVFVARGVNSFDLAYRNRDEQEQTLALAHSAGVNTVRFWLFGDGFDEGFQPKAGVLNEERFRAVDSIVEIAERQHIRLIPTLVNNWDDYGGKRQYVSWTGYEGDADSDEFYSDNRTISLFENYVNAVLSRKNLLTGKQYSEDPTILAWDVINEPRVSLGQDDRLLSFAEKMSDFLRKKDAQHLILFGTENLSENNFLGRRICALPNVDVCSTHWYFEYEGVPLYENMRGVALRIHTEKDVAQSVNKPIIAGEVGIQKYFRLFNIPPTEFLEQTIQLLKEDDYSGYLVWNWALKPDHSFGFSENGSNGYTALTLKQILDANR